MRLKLPSRIEYRHLALRVVGSACNLVPDRGDGFHDEVVSAFGEAFNNVIVHGCGAGAGDLEIEIETGRDHMTIRMMDYGNPLDLASAVDPDLDALPERGVGMFILRSFMDDVTYVRGRPNVLSMTKRVEREGR
jgi:serine/threonine-protein kinase RsbW